VNRKSKSVEALKCVIGWRRRGRSWSPGPNDRRPDTLGGLLRRPQSPSRKLGRGDTSEDRDRLRPCPAPSCKSSPFRRLFRPPGNGLRSPNAKSRNRLAVLSLTGTAVWKKLTAGAITFGDEVVLFLQIDALAIFRRFMTIQRFTSGTESFADSWDRWPSTPPEAPARTLEAPNPRLPTPPFPRPSWPTGRGTARVSPPAPDALGMDAEHVAGDLGGADQRCAGLPRPGGRRRRDHAARLGHVLPGLGTGHSAEWKRACERLGLRRAMAAGQRYALAAIAPDIRTEVVRLSAAVSGPATIWGCIEPEARGWPPGSLRQSALRGARLWFRPLGHLPSRDLTAWEAPRVPPRRSQGCPRTPRRRGRPGRPPFPPRLLPPLPSSDYTDAVSNPSGGGPHAHGI
jgi:hypothetical protein